MTKDHFEITIEWGRVVVMVRDGIGWIRVGRYCVTWKDTDRYPLVFSERNGYTTSVQIGRYFFTWIARHPSF